VILMLSEAESPVEVILGNLDDCRLESAWAPFDDRVITYLGDLSRAILATPNVRDYPDLVSLAYWCRPAAVRRLATRYRNDEFLMGRGLTFHIPPSNVPLNFAYSLFCGLLAGNSNVLRLSSIESDEVNLLISTMSRVPSPDVSRRMCLVRYGHNDLTTRWFSMQSSARVIWGGNETVRRIRAIEASARSVDVSFADRVSMSLLRSAVVSNLTSVGLKDLAEGFIADGYTFEQNACSSPRVVVWDGLEAETRKAKNRFWEAVESRLQSKGTLSPAHHMRRFTELCEHLAGHESRDYLTSITGGAARIELMDGSTWQEYSGLRFGTFTEVSMGSPDHLPSLVSADVQTLGYFGYSVAEIRDTIGRLRMAGIDRVVPIGQALNFDTVWDGYDLIRSLSRTIVII
jgi:hypothetical protein